MTQTCSSFPQEQRAGVWERRAAALQSVNIQYGCHSIFMTKLTATNFGSSSVDPQLNCI